MNIYQRLKRDHAKHRELAFELMETSGDTTERRALFDRLKSDVEAHAAAEEETFYASLMAEPEGQKRSRHSVSEHKEAADSFES